MNRLSPAFCGLAILLGGAASAHELTTFVAVASEYSSNAEQRPGGRDEVMTSGELVFDYLRDRVQATMHARDPGLPAHPDDATALLYRRGARR